MMLARTPTPTVGRGAGQRIEGAPHDRAERTTKPALTSGAGRASVFSTARDAKCWRAACRVASSTSLWDCKGASPLLGTERPSAQCPRFHG